MRLSTLFIAAATPGLADAVPPPAAAGVTARAATAGPVVCDNLVPKRRNASAPRQDALVPVETSNQWALGAGLYGAFLAPFVMTEAGAAAAWLATPERVGLTPGAGRKAVAGGAIVGALSGGAASVTLLKKIVAEEMAKVTADHCLTDPDTLVGHEPSAGPPRCFVASPVLDNVTGEERYVPVPTQNLAVAVGASIGTVLSTVVPVVAAPLISNALTARQGLLRPARIAVNCAAATFAAVVGGSASLTVDTLVAGPERRKPLPGDYCGPGVR